MKKGYPQSYQNKKECLTVKANVPFVIETAGFKRDRRYYRTTGKIGTFDILIVSRRHATWQES